MPKTTPKSAEPQHRLIRLTDVMARTSLSKTTIWRHARQGTFPKAVVMTQGTIGWLAAEVDDWIASRIAARDALYGDVRHGDAMHQGAPANQ